MNTCQKKFAMLSVGLLSLLGCNAQRKPADIMQFLDVPQLSRLVSTGGLHATSPVATAAGTFHNPAVVSDSISGSVDLGIAPVADGIKYISAATAHNVKGLGTFALGIQFAGYGDFVRTDEEGNELGSFGARETAFYLTYCRRMAPCLMLGATLKPMFSTMDNETAIGLALDIGADISGADGRLKAGLVFRNAGGIIKNYSGDESHSKIPFDIRTTVCYKAENAPFRILFTLKDLTKWDLRTSSKKLNGVDNFFRHTIWGLEFTPVKSFYFGLGYDQRRRRELRSSQTGGMAGISWGLGLKISNIEVQYAHNRYHVAGSLNSITLSTNWRRLSGR